MPLNRLTKTVSVQPLGSVKKTLTYKVPPSLSESISIGSLIWVPVGKKSVLAIVRSFDPQDGYLFSRLRKIQKWVYPFPILTDELLILADWMCCYYAISLDRLFETMIPSAVRRGMGQKEERILILSHQLSLEEREQLKRKAPQQAILYETLYQKKKPLLRNILLKQLVVSPQSCDSLIKKGFIAEKVKTIERTPYQEKSVEKKNSIHHSFKLNAEQESCVAALIQSLNAKKFRTHLLHGVTGSGKTEVYISAMKHALQSNGSVLFLVPEVTLAPQTVSQLKVRLQEEGGGKVVVWHSQLSEGERFDAWHALVTEQARVVVGTRSALFAPMPRLRLIIVDEEHEPAYKQEESPRYHGRDVAVYRALLCQAVCVLGSATPSLESLYNVKKGKYSVNHLTRRVDNRELPCVHIVNMTREKRANKSQTLFSRLLIEKIRDRLEKKEQTILFLNRRGYASSILCTECGWVPQCPHCSVALTWHREEKKLCCHWCDFSSTEPLRCSQCQCKKIYWKGMGTERIEETILQIVPHAKVVRVDKDTLRKKNRLWEIFNDFRCGKIDMLIGTQMIAKGLDFPNVTLVGMLGADLTLHLPDFRATERTFQLIVQVTGRAGRGDRSGEVVIQSFLPSSMPIQFARRNDFDGFLEQELEHRKQYQYPPFRHLIHHLFRGKNPEKVIFYAEHWTRFLEKEIKSTIEIRGPAPAPIEKVKDYYRFQIWYFVKNVSTTIGELVTLRQAFKMDGDVIDVFDVDPTSVI